MATIDKRIDREMERLDEHHDEEQIPTVDYEEFKGFAEYLEGSDSSKTTQRAYMVRLRVLSRRADKPVMEMTTEEIQQLFRDMENGRHPDVKDGGISVSDFHDAINRFEKWADIPADPGEIEYKKKTGNNLTADNLLFQDEVDALLDACGMDVRYKSMFAWMLAAGQRLDAVRSVRLKHLDFDGPAGSITIPPDAQTKGASGSRPMLWAKGYIREWLQSHPYTDANGEPEDPDAALWCPAPGQAPTSPDGGKDPLAPNTIRHNLKRTAEKAGIDKRVYPHLFRHTAGTRMVLDGLSEQQIKSILGWSSESGQFETYAHLADKLRDDSIREAYGLPKSESGTPTIGMPTLERCPNCNDQLPEGWEICRTCNSAMTKSAAEEGPIEGAAEEDVREGYREAEDMDTVEKIQAIDELLGDEELRELLRQQLEE